MSAASSYTLTVAPSTGEPEGPFVATVTPNGTFTGTITLTPTGAPAAGLTPQVLTYTGGSGALTATFYPTATGTLTITGTHTGSITDPSAATATVVAGEPALASLLPPTATSPGATSGFTNTGKSIFTFTNTITVTLNADPSAVIYFTTNGHDPQPGMGGGVANGFELTLTQSTTVKLQSSAAGLVSPVETFDFCLLG